MFNNNGVVSVLCFLIGELPIKVDIDDIQLPWNIQSGSILPPHPYSSNINKTIIDSYKVQENTTEFTCTIMS